MNASEDATKLGKHERRKQITFTIAPKLLAQVDELAEKMTHTRSGLITQAIYEFVRRNRGVLTAQKDPEDAA